MAIMFKAHRAPVIAGVSLALSLVLATAGVALGAPNPEASCVGLASAFFAEDGIRDDVAHAINVRFGIPPGAEVSRFARVQLDDLEACLLDGQG
jgi:hypothetical protein